ncbi:MAG: nuclear transport factor 2 family protein [Acidobacteriota bacterium]|nr:nuclear transport factor 2 family protein [Acidobacteriota bacterium]
MSAQDNIQTVKDIYAAFNRGDRSAMTAALAENVELQSEAGANEIPWAGVHHGHSEFMAILDQLAEHVQFDSFEQLDYLASENQVAVVNRMEWTLKKTVRRSASHNSYNCGPSTLPGK